MRLREKIFDILIGRRKRFWKRSRYILTIFAKYGFGEIVKNISPSVPLPLSRKTSGPPDVRFRKALEDLGPIFIKIGQLLSLRPDILPVNYIRELSKLQDHVEPIPFEKIEGVLQNELGESIHTYVKELDKKPLASGSVAQVHRAVLKDGKEVVFKVIKPDVRETIKEDAEVITWLADFADRHIQEFKEMDIRDRIREILEALSKETDLEREGWNIERFKKIWGEHDPIVVPEVYWPLVTKDVLVMDYLDGIKISEIDELKRENHDLTEIVRRGIDLILKQVFESGYFHGDPHAGNIMVFNDGRLAFIDFGQMGLIEPYSRRKLLILLKGIVDADIDKIVYVLKSLGAIEGYVDISELKRDLSDLILKYHGIPLKNIRIKQFIDDIFKISRKHRLRLPDNLVLLARTSVILEGLGSILTPDFDFVEEAKPFAENAVRKEWSPIRIIRKGLDNLPEYLDMLEDMPLLYSIPRNVDLDKGSSEKGRQRDIASLGLALAGGFIASSLFIIFKIPPLFKDVSILGLAGFLLSWGGTIYLLWNTG